MTFLELRDKLNSLPEDTLNVDASTTFIGSSGKEEGLKITGISIGRIQRNTFYKEHAQFNVEYIGKLGD